MGRFILRAWACALLLAALPLGNVLAESVRVGFGVSKPPYVFEYEDRGLEVDIVRAAMREGGLDITPYYAPLERLDLMMRRGELDAMAASLPSGTLPAYFSDPYLHYHNVAVALASRNLRIDSIADLGDLSVSAFQRARSLLGVAFGEMARTNPRYREEPRQVTRNNLLYAGRIDVIIGDRRIIEYFARHPEPPLDSSQPVHVYPLFPPTPYCVAFLQPAARDAFNEGLLKIRQTGEYSRILQRYVQH